MTNTIHKTGRRNENVDWEALPNQARRLRGGQSLASLAVRIGVKAQSLSEYELTGNGIGMHKQYALAEALGVSWHELVEPGKKFELNIRQQLDIIR